MGCCVMPRVFRATIYGLALAGLTFLTLETASAGPVRLYTVDSLGERLVVVDPATGATTVLGMSGRNYGDTDMTLTDDGRLFVLNRDEFFQYIELTELNPITGELIFNRVIFGGGVRPYQHAEGLAFLDGALVVGSPTFDTFSLSGDLLSKSTSLFDEDGLASGGSYAPLVGVDAARTSTFYFLDPASGTKTPFFSLSDPFRPNDLVIHGDLMYVVSHLTSSILTVDLLSNTIINHVNINAAGRFHGLALAPQFMSVPEPTTAVIFLFGLLLISVQRRRRSVEEIAVVCFFDTGARTNRH